MDADSGELLWHYAEEGLLDFESAENMVYLISYEHVYALDANSGQAVWRSNLGELSNAAPAVVDGVAYVISSADVIFALDSRTGEEFWRYDPGGKFPSPHTWSTVSCTANCLTASCLQ